MMAMLIFFTRFELDPEFSYIISLVFSGLLIGFLISELTIQGKEMLLLYKSTSTGTWKYIFSKLIFYLLIIIPLVLIFITIINLLAPGITLETLIRNNVAVMMIAFGMTMLTMGLFLLNPAFTDKDPAFMLNFQVIIFTSIFTFIPMLIFFRDLTFIEVQITHLLFVTILGLVFFLAGKRKLETIE